MRNFHNKTAHQIAIELRRNDLAGLVGYTVSSDQARQEEEDRPYIEQAKKDKLEYEEEELTRKKLSNQPQPGSYRPLSRDVGKRPLGTPPSSGEESEDSGDDGDDEGRGQKRTLSDDAKKQDREKQRKTTALIKTFLRAAKYGDVSTITRMLSDTHLNINKDDRLEEGGPTALEYAYKYQHAPVIAALLNHSNN